MPTLHETRKYEQYLFDPSIPLAKATAWRHRKRMNADPSTSSKNWKQMQLDQYNVTKLNKYCTASNNDHSKNGDDNALMFDDNGFDDAHNGNEKE
uniref:Uncharacterized protein n=1 Tax=Amphimedon queenslandica TaxID=400682 RepID=A0A1X7VTH2_AMPQE